MEGQLRYHDANIKLEITGKTPLNFDLRKVSADDVTHAEERAMPVTLVLLLLAFRQFCSGALTAGSRSALHFDGAGCGCATRTLSAAFDSGEKPATISASAWASTTHC